MKRGDYMIEIVDVKKKYGEKIALDGVDLSIKEGEIFGVLGPNGAGKTTLIKVICGLVKKDEGKVTILGKDIDEEKNFNEIKKNMLVVFDNSCIYEELTASENLNFAARLWGMKQKNLQTKISECLSYFEIENNNVLARNYSMGMKQRLSLARAFLINPQILIMDEPLTGLDANSVIHVRNFVNNLKNQGKTILFSSHNLGEVEKVVDRLAILNNGKVEICDEIVALRRRYLEGSRYVVYTKNGDKLVKHIDKQIGKSVKVDKESVTFNVLNFKNFISKLSLIDNSDIGITGISEVVATVEDIFIDITHKDGGKI
jgi:ABC-2 type transport system ATP-binding protein